MRRWFVHFLAVWLLVGASVASATEGDKLKAAFLFRFMQFVEWPAGAKTKSGAKAQVCVIGANEIADALDAIQGRKVNGLTVEVQRLADAATLDRCLVVFIGEGRSENLQRMIAAGHRNHVLTVSDLDNFAATGGIIQLVQVDNRLGFSVNATSARMAGLKLSSQMLKLAVNVLE